MPSNRLVSGAGDIKLTKDGNVLLHEMVRGCSTRSKMSGFSALRVVCRKVFNVIFNRGHVGQVSAGLSDSGGSAVRALTIHTVPGGILQSQLTFE